MSQYLETLAIGDTIDVKGPIGHVHYLGQVRCCCTTLALSRTVVACMCCPAAECRLQLGGPVSLSCFMAILPSRGPRATIRKQDASADPVCCPVQGRYTLDGEAQHATHISMIAGGTGITPMYQVWWVAQAACAARLGCVPLWCRWLVCGSKCSSCHSLSACCPGGGLVCHGLSNLPLSA